MSGSQVRGRGGRETGCWQKGGDKIEGGARGRWVGITYMYEYDSCVCVGEVGVSFSG